MAFVISDFADLRPFVYHLTDCENIRALATRPVLEPAVDLLNRAGLAASARQRRAAALPVVVDGRRVNLKDQKPLIFANAELAAEWDHGDFVEFLNQHVYFWPGDAQGPVKYGQRLFAAYADDSPAVLRIDTRDLLAANAERDPLFCAFNSGAPRMNAGKRVPRGPDLFTSASAFPRRASEVVELVFRGAVTLPSSTHVRTPRTGWTELGVRAI